MNKNICLLAFLMLNLSGCLEPWGACKPLGPSRRHTPYTSTCSGGTCISQPIYGEGVEPVAQIASDVTDGYEIYPDAAAQDDTAQYLDYYEEEPYYDERYEADYPYDQYEGEYDYFEDEAFGDDDEEDDLSGDEDGEQSDVEDFEEDVAPAAGSGHPPQELRTLYFKADEDEIADEQIETLEGDVELMHDLRDGDYRFRVEGHACDSAGNEEENKALSRRRAEAVKQYLVSQGIDGEAVEVVAHGCLKKIVEEGDREEQAPNRRVEIFAFAP